MNDRIQLQHISTDQEFRSRLQEDVRAGFSLTPKQLPPKYFYDPDGSDIFDRITELPEYYVTRAETEALASAADDITSNEFLRLTEIGSGSSKKTRSLLEAMHRRSPEETIVYATLDISESAIFDAAQSLLKDYPWLRIEALVGDFLVRGALTRLIEADEPQLLIFLGSTLGNLSPDQRDDFFDEVSSALRPDDRMLVGVDLVKDISTIYAAYNDAAGVTEEFNKNVIKVLRRELGATVTPEDFDHDAPYIADLQRIEMRLYAREDLTIVFEQADLDTALIAKGEYILTELSCKFTRPTLEGELGKAGLDVLRWDTDSESRVAVVLAGRRTA